MKKILFTLGTLAGLFGCCDQVLAIKETELVRDAADAVTFEPLVEEEPCERKAIQFLSDSGANLEFIRIVQNGTAADVTRLKALIAAGGTGVLEGDRGWVCLVNCQDPDIAQTLVENGANVKATDKDSKTALHLVENPGVAEILVKAGANMEAKDHLGNTPLLAHCDDCHQEIANWLVQNGADCNAINAWRKTALHVATEHGLVGTIKLLIERGADIELLDYKERMPMWYTTDESIRGMFRAKKSEMEMAR